MDYLKIVLGLSGVGNLANGLWMLAAPRTWYLLLPAGIPDFGAYNEHFIRDLGIMFTVFGAALAFAAFKPAVRATVISLLLLWFSLHSVLHVVEVLRGYVEAVHLWVDIPLCHVPTVILAGLLVLERRKTHEAR